MYLYDTRYDEDTISRFPIQGWLFPCWGCGCVTSRKKPLFYDKKIVCIPFCRDCKHVDISTDVIYRHLVKQITDHLLV